MLKKAFLIIPLVLLSACESFTADRYVPSSSNQAALNNISTSRKFSIAPFSVANATAIDVSCRLAGPIQVAGLGKHEEYIQKAFIDELQAAGMYSPKASKAFKADIQNINVTTVTPASWVIDGDFYMNDTLVKTVATKFPFKTSYSALGACNNAAENFPYAVESFLGEFIKSPEFKRQTR